MSEKYPSQLAEKIVIRLPDGMRDELAVRAKENGRSVNAEVVARLQFSLSQTKTQIRTGLPLPEASALRAAMQAIQFAMEHQQDIEELFQAKGVEIPWQPEHVQEPKKEPTSSGS